MVLNEGYGYADVNFQNGAVQEQEAECSLLTHENV